MFVSVAVDILFYLKTGLLVVVLNYLNLFLLRHTLEAVLCGSISSLNHLLMFLLTPAKISH